MKRFVFKIILLSLLVYLIDKPIGFGISELNIAKQFDNRIDLIFQGKINQEIIVLGSSRAVNGINPKEIELVTGETCYNLGFSGANLNFQETILNFLLANSTPKKILLIMDEESAFLRNSKSIFRKDKLAPFLKYNMVLDKYIEHSSKNQICSVLSWTYRENQNFFKAIEYLQKGKNIPDETSAINKYGAILLDSNLNHVKNPNRPHKIKTYDRTIEDAKLVDKFHEIIRTSEQKNIKLYLVRLPRYKSELLGFNSRLNDFLDKDNVELIDLSETVLDISHYFDTGHLNEKGATKISHILSQNIN